MCLVFQVCISQSRWVTCGGRCCPQESSSSTTLYSFRALEWYDIQSLLQNPEQHTTLTVLEIQSVVWELMSSMEYYLTIY